MKKIVNRKKYDTETAEEIAMYHNGLCTSDFRSLTERLYRKKSGEYFLSGIGGPMTHYGRPCGSNGMTNGRDITPMTESEAKKWVEQYANDAYEEIFGEVEE